MKTTRRNAPQAETYRWLVARDRNGTRRIEKLGWKRLARIYEAAQPNSPERRAINREALRCGYTPRVVLTLNAE